MVKAIITKPQHTAKISFFAQPPMDTTAMRMIAWWAAFRSEKMGSM
jgi:hypothetical protein